MMIFGIYYLLGSVLGTGNIEQITHTHTQTPDIEETNFFFYILAKDSDAQMLLP